MFALVTTCQNLTELETLLPREEKLGLVGDHHHFNLLTHLQVMKHAGVAITITTFTDLIAFAIGSFSKVYFVK